MLCQNKKRLNKLNRLSQSNRVVHPSLAQPHRSKRNRGDLRLREQGRVGEQGRGDELARRPVHKRVRHQ